MLAKPGGRPSKSPPPPPPAFARINLLIRFTPLSFCTWNSAVASDLPPALLITCGLADPSGKCDLGACGQGLGNWAPQCNPKVVG